jgi:hypothetical protein
VAIAPPKDTSFVFSRQIKNPTAAEAMGDFFGAFYRSFATSS